MFNFLESVFQKNNDDFLYLYNRCAEDHHFIDKLTLALIHGYEIDEFDVLKNLGVYQHKYRIKTQLSANDTIGSYLPSFNDTFMIFSYHFEDFIGTIWIPYYSKKEYEVNYDFRYDHEMLTYKQNRYGEISASPQWFQDIYYAADTYVKERNKK